jgi:AraC-like DNA-binding protein
MIAEQHIPSPPLSQFVRMLWYYDGFEQPHARERLLPDGTMSLVVNLNESRMRLQDSRERVDVEDMPAHVLSGPRSGYLVVSTRNMVHTLGVHFCPGGAFPFLRMPAGELSERVLSLDLLWGREGDDLRVRLLEAPTPGCKFRVIERWLLERLAKPLERNPAVSYALQQFQQRRCTPSIGGIVDKIGISQRRFIELFTAQVGLTPKVFSRVMRFQHSVHSVVGRNVVDWVQLALDCGYYDQAHFIHDFQAFSGITPSTYLASGPRYVNHVPLAV